MPAAGASERIAVTGVGAVTALGSDLRESFRRLLAGERGFRPVSLFEVGEQRCSIAAEVSGLRVSDVAPRGQAESWSRTDAMALLAAREALSVAGGLRSGERLGVSVGGTTGGMFETEQELLAAPHAELGLARAERLMAFPLSSTSERLAEAFGSVARTATICSACSSGAIALAQGMAWLRGGEVERVLAGGADALCRLTYVGFNALGATDPGPCRPFDVRRAGLSLGEAAAFLVLETESSALARGAPILAFLSGAAVLAEAHHITHPEPSGERAAELMARALASAGLSPLDVDYVNAHGTGTVQNDAMEAAALRRVFDEHLGRVLVSSSKGQVGHTLGAAGALEAAITVLALEQGMVPPTAGLELPQDGAVPHVLGSGKRASLRAALSSSFGFGGMGCVLAFEQASAPKRSVARPTSRSFVVTGACALGTLGLSCNAEAAAYLDPELRPALAPSVALDPLAALDVERSRRFDRAAALVTLGAERAAAAAGREAQGTGLVVGSAFGNVQRSVAFLLRVAERGAKYAQPAEFPHLVASAGSGNASIYAGFNGPVLTVSEREQSSEAALARALSLLELDAAAAVVAGAAEARDAIVERVLGASELGVARSEGGGFVTIEHEAGALARGARPLARIEAHEQIFDDLGAALEQRVPSHLQLAVVTAATSADVIGVVQRSAWAQARFHSVLARSGYHEASAALALSAAVGLIAAGSVDEALVISGRGTTAYITHLVRPGGQQ